jgi:DNA polymerase-3 subunit epsilon
MRRPWHATLSLSRRWLVRPAAKQLGLRSLEANVAASPRPRKDRSMTSLEHERPVATPHGAQAPDPQLVPDWAHERVPLTRPLAVIDLEATGTAPHRDRIVEISVLKIFPDGRKILRHRRLNPGMPIPPEATEVHGIHDEDVANEPEFRSIAASLSELLADCDLAGFGIVQFDMPMLRTEFDRAGVEFDIEGRRILDAKAIYHQMEPRDLSAAHRYYCGEPFEAAHSAEADTLATYRVLVSQLRRYPELPSSLDDLHKLSNPRQADFVDSEGKLIWRNNEVHFNFGKHKGVPLREVCAIDIEYVRWLTVKDFRADLKTVLSAALEGRYPPPRVTIVVPVATETPGA